MKEAGMTTINDDLIKRSVDIRWPVGFDPVHADLLAHNSIVINAPVKSIWATLIAAAAWPELYSNASDVVIHAPSGELGADVTFSWTTFGLTRDREVKRAMKKAADSAHPQERHVDLRHAEAFWVERDAEPAEEVVSVHLVPRIGNGLEEVRGSTDPAAVFGGLVLSVRVRGVIAQVADEADHVVRHQAADRPRGVDADHHLAVGVENEPGGLEEPSLGIDERARGCRDRFGVGGMSDRERQAVFRHEFGGRRLVFDCEGHHLGTYLRQVVRGSLESA
jgi:hypothetical protein